MSVRNEHRDRFLTLLKETGKTTITKQEIRDLCKFHSMKVPQWFTKDEANRISRGIFRIPDNDENSFIPDSGVRLTTEESVTVPDLNEVNFQPLTAAPKTGPRIVSIISTLEEQGIIPQQYKNYVPFGNFDDLKSIIASKQFYPVFITGPSGNGKSMSVEQACALLNREYVCVSMTPETDEGDLLGNYVLIDNQMVWRDGPITTAAKRGAVLCIDEIDYGAQNLSCLQRVLEGKPFLLKKKNEIVEPKDGFQIIATANTKGKGSEDGRYMFTNVLNEAFLERFPITFEQEWAPNNVEKRILKKELEMAGKADDEFASNLVMWATTIRKTFEEEGSTNEVISTRRLVHIVRAYQIFNGDRLKCIKYCLNRFDHNTKNGFLDLYTKIDQSVNLSLASAIVTDPNQPTP